MRQEWPDETDALSHQSPAYYFRHSSGSWKFLSGQDTAHFSKTHREQVPNSAYPTFDIRWIPWEEVREPVEFHSG